MKEYDRIVIWLDYLDSQLSRSYGRRVPASRAISKPSLTELEEAARRLGYSPNVSTVSHPKRSWISTGLISLEKKKKKSELLRDLVGMITKVRSEKKN